MKYFLAFWCCEGFEYIADISEHQHWEANNTALVLAGQEPDKSCKLSQQITAMKLRAQFNPQRNYELYAFTATDSVAEQDLKDWAESSPQTLADWIRANGSAIVTKTPAPRAAIV